MTAAGAIAQVSVNLVAQRGSVHAVGEVRQVLAGALPEGLRLLRGVDSGQPDGLAGAMRELAPLWRTTPPEPLLGSPLHAVIAFGEPDHRQ